MAFSTTLKSNLIWRTGGPPARLRVSPKQRGAAKHTPVSCAANNRNREAGRVVGLQDILVTHEAREYSNLTMPQLKAMLRERGLKVSGSKAELIARLQGQELPVPSDTSRPQQQERTAIGKQNGPRKGNSKSSKEGSSGPPNDPVEDIARMMLANGVGVPESYISNLNKKSRVTASDKETDGAKKLPAASGAKTIESRGVQAVNTSQNADSSSVSQPRRPGRFSRAGQVDKDIAASSAFTPHSRKIGNREQEGRTRMKDASEGSSNNGGRRQKQRQQRRTIQNEENQHTVPQKLKVPGAVLVEGTFDVQAVKRSIAAQDVIPLQEWAKTSGRGKEYRRRVAEIGRTYEKVFVLLDPDNAGHELRTEISQILPGALHAFVPVRKCSAKNSTKHHEVGNVGVEHAADFDIQDALLRARVAKTDRKEFSKEEMMGWGLAGMHGTGPQEQWSAYGGVSTRRRLFAEELGLHDGSAKVILKNLNHFFKREEVVSALERLPGPGEKIPEKMTDGIADEIGQGTNPGNASSSLDDWPAEFPMYPMKR